MGLDKRIESTDYIFTPFSSYILAGQHVGKNGYFANTLEAFSDLTQCEHGTLSKVSEDADIPYNYRLGNAAFYKYFIPAECINDEEPKFRPFNLHEFLAEFPMVTVITLKHKDDNDSFAITYAVTGYRTASNGSTDVCLGADWYSFEELAEKYLYKNTSGEWVAFGVKEL